MATATASTFKPSTDKRPSNAQWWKIATTLLELAGEAMPSNRAEASQVIDRLIEAKSGGGDDCPM